nr:hypothetical protein [Tanacetum cinerariifolium]
GLLPGGRVFWLQSPARRRGVLRFGRGPRRLDALLHSGRRLCPAAAQPRGEPAAGAPAGRPQARARRAAARHGLQLATPPRGQCPAG